MKSFSRLAAPFVAAGTLALAPTNLADARKPRTVESMVYEVSDAARLCVNAINEGAPNNFRDDEGRLVEEFVSRTEKAKDTCTILRKHTVTKPGTGQQELFRFRRESVPSNELERHAGVTLGAYAVNLRHSAAGKGFLSTVKLSVGDKDETSTADLGGLVFVDKVTDNAVSMPVSTMNGTTTPIPSDEIARYMKIGRESLESVLSAAGHANAKKARSPYRDSESK